MFQFRKWRREFGIRKRSRLANTTVPLQPGNLIKLRYLLHDPAASRVVCFRAHEDIRILLAPGTGYECARLPAAIQSGSVTATTSRSLVHPRLTIRFRCTP